LSKQQRLERRRVVLSLRGASLKRRLAERKREQRDLLDVLHSLGDLDPLSGAPAGTIIMRPEIEADLLQSCARLSVFGEPVPSMYRWSFKVLLEERRKREPERLDEDLAEALRNEIWALARTLRRRTWAEMPVPLPAEIH
jgi:hypothetical protein